MRNMSPLVIVLMIEENVRSLMDTRERKGKKKKGSVCVWEGGGRCDVYFKKHKNTTM